MTLTPTRQRQMRLPLAATEHAAATDDADPAHANPSLTSIPCPRCRGVGTSMRRQEIIARCYACGLRALHGDGVRYCEHHACSFCRGTGSVCAKCHGTRWLRRPVFPVGSEAVRCPACHEAPVAVAVATTKRRGGRA